MNCTVNIFWLDFYNFILHKRIIQSKSNEGIKYIEVPTDREYTLIIVVEM